MREYLQGLYVWRNGEHTPSGCSKWPSSKAAADGSTGGVTFSPAHPKLPRQLVLLEGYVEDAFEARTMHGRRRVLTRRDRVGELRDFFSILSEKLPQDIAKLCQSWYNSDPVPLCGLLWAYNSANNASVTRLGERSKEKKRWYLRRCF